MEKDKNPFVSICVPTYNSASYIENTLESILNQTYKNIEIVIVDNASTDKTMEILKKYNDSRIFVHRNPVNIVAEDNFNQCIELAKGEFMAIYHSDDVYEPTMVEKEVNYLLAYPDAGAVFTEGNLIDEEGKVIGKLAFSKILTRKETYSFNEIFNAILKEDNFLVCPTAMVRTGIYRKVGGFRWDKFRTSSDLGVWLSVLQYYKIGILNEELISRRRHREQGGSIYNKLRTEEADFLKVFDYFVKTLPVSVKSEEYRLYIYNKKKDKLLCGINAVISGNIKKAYGLLKEGLDFETFFCSLKFKGIKRFLAGFSLFILISIGLGGFARYFLISFLKIYGLYKMEWRIYTEKQLVSN